MNEKECDEMPEKKENASTPPENSEGKKGKKKRRMLRLAAWGMAGVLGLVVAAGGGALLFLRSSAGEAWLTRTINESLAALPSGLSVHVESLAGPLPSHIELSGIVLRDSRGAWLEADSAELHIDWSTLPKVFTVAEVSLKSPRVLRLPHMEENAVEKIPSEPLSTREAINTVKNVFQTWPDWLPAFRLDRLTILWASLPESVVGINVSATFEGNASLTRNGAQIACYLKRDDELFPPLSLQADLSSELELVLQADGSDLGFSALLPGTAGSDAHASFHLSGRGNPSFMQTNLTIALLDDTGESMLSASADSEFSLLGRDNEHPSGSASVRLESGAASDKLWAAAGQKTGKFKASARVQALYGTQGEAWFSTTMELADMVWANSTLTSLFGSNCVLHGEGKATLASRGNLRTELADLTIQTAGLRGFMTGSATLSEGRLLSPENRMMLHAVCDLDKTGILSPDLSGHARFTADLAGPLTALNTKFTLKSDKLVMAGTSLEKAEAELSFPHADIPRMADELPRMVSAFRQELPDKSNESRVLPHGSSTAFTPEHKNGIPLLTGRAKASLRLNGQKTGIDTSWSMEEKATEQGGKLCLALDNLDIRIEDNAVTGKLLAAFPLESSAAKPGTMAALIGMTPPDLDGQLDIRIPRWASLARVSGLNLSGTPLNAELKLSSLERQNLTWKARLDSFRFHAMQGDISLAGFKTDISVKDLWGVPDVALNGNLNRLTMPACSLSRLQADVRGSRNSLQFSLQSRGDIRCDAQARWKPNESTLEKLDIAVNSSVLGLSGNVPVGIRLDAPASVRLRGDEFFLSGASFTALPGGILEFAGSWGPKRLNVSASIRQLDLARLRPILLEMPEGLLNCRTELTGTMSRPSGNLKLNLKNIRLPGSTLPPVSADVAGILGVSGKRRQLSLTLDLPEETRTALGLSACDVQLELPFSSPAHGISMPDFKAPLRGDVLLSGELGQIWKLLPLADQRLSGQVNLTSRLAGTISAPELTLHASLDKGRFADLVQGVELRDIRLRADTDRLNIVRRSGSPLTLSFSAGDGRKGTVTMDGWFDPSDMQLSATGKLDHLSPLRRQDINIMLSGTLSAGGSVASPKLSADITVDKGQVQLADLPGSDIVTLPIEEEGQKAAPPAKSMNGSMNIHVRIPNQFFIRGYGLECEWKGDIRARGPFATPGITGNIQAVRGGLDILGKHFKLAEGRISFDGGWPVSPMLNIIMEYTASNITADVTVSGSATKPEISLSSQPAMPQDEIISQIMFGQSAGTLSHVQALQLAAGAAQLAGLGGPDVMGFGRDLLGLDVFKLNSESTSSGDGNSDMSKTSLEMGTYVLDNVYVGVEQGIGKESETDAVVEIELTPSLEAQAKASSNKTEVGLEWKKNY